MKALLIYPEFEKTYWSWIGILKRYVGKKGAFPPLGLLTVAAMLPKDWELKVVDMNVEKLANQEIRWADRIFVSAMVSQRESALDAIGRCTKLGKHIVLGGPILETPEDCGKFLGVSHFFLGEADDTITEYLADYESGQAKRIYQPPSFPDLAKRPIPRWDLINPAHYSSALVQFSAACPFTCTFCNSKRTSGPVWRAKPVANFLAELKAMLEAGFKRSVLLADENFVGKFKKAKEVLSELIAWQAKHGHPFEFTAQVPVTVADDDELLEMKARAGFVRLFLGIETFNEAALRECRKLQNLGRNVVADVHKIFSYGIDVAAGLIVGFDSDPQDPLANDIIVPAQETGITMAMVDTLQAQPGTVLYEKLSKQGRLLRNAVNNMDWCTNFVPAMPMKKLAERYKRIVSTLYRPKEYYERILVFLRKYNPSKRAKKGLSWADTKALARSVFWIGLLGGFEVSYYYWKALFVAFTRYRQAFPQVVAKQIHAAHFRQVAKEIERL